jgi:crotonobetainyl-CoA:carnitine CoA-transferase CaiB-like acyl-CoA transferase
MRPWNRLWRASSNSSTRRNPQLLHHGSIVERQHARLGTIRSGTVPIRFAEEVEPASRRAAPTLGQHNREVLSRLGYSEQEIRELQDSGVITADKSPQDASPESDPHQ